MLSKDNDIIQHADKLMKLTGLHFFHTDNDFKNIKALIMKLSF